MPRKPAAKKIPTPVAAPVLKKAPEPKVLSHQATPDLRIVGSEPVTRPAPPPDKPIAPRIMFKKVHQAREALRQRAEELISEYIDIAKQAKVSGDYESAYKALQWLIEHIPAEEDGTRVVDRSPDKVPVNADNGNKGPSIQIGIQLGGIEGRKALPAGEVIDADPLKPS